jgi:site-specific DNA-cytosine methylase
MGRKSFIPPDYNTTLEAHHSILYQLAVMEPFIQQHINEVHKQNPGHMDDSVMKQHKQRFKTWLMVKDIPHGETIEEQTVKGLAYGPPCQVTTWQTYDISGFIFCTKSKDKKSMSQNSGVRCEAIDDETGEIITYFGFIEDIWQLDYGTF